MNRPYLGTFAPWRRCGIILLLIFLSGCSIFAGARDLFYRDVTRTMEIAAKYGDPQMKVCAEFIQGQIDWTRAVLDEPTAGLISRAFRDYLAAVEARGQEAAFETACGQIIGKIAIKGLRSFGG